MAGSVFSSSTVNLRIAVVALIVVFIIHVIGFALPRWSTLKLGVRVSSLSLESSYHVGLWQDCGCASLYGKSACTCTSKHNVAGSLKAVQIMETLGLIGLIISGVLIFIILYSSQGKTLKILNMVIVFGSGVCIIIGVIVYGFECNDDLDDLFSYAALLLSTVSMNSTSATLSTSFILCTIAGSLCLLLCTVLLIKDYRTAVQPTDLIMHLPVQYSHRGQIIGPPQGQAQVVITTPGQQPFGNMQPSAHPYYGPAPTYSPENQLNQKNLKIDFQNLAI